MDMKRFAVFAKRVENPKHAEFVIWHFLNDTDNADEAFLWYMTAKNNKDYTDVQIVESVYMQATKIV